jgi:hypothetical protein
MRSFWVGEGRVETFPTALPESPIASARKKTVIVIAGREKFFIIEMSAQYKNPNSLQQGSFSHLKSSAEISGLGLQI